MDALVFKFKSFPCIILFCFFSYLSNAQGELYWTDLGAGKMMKQDLNDSSEPEILLSESFLVFHTIDLNNEWLYWIDRGKLALYKSKLDGSDQQAIVTDLGEAGGMTLDDAGHLFYVNDDKIMMADTDGNNNTSFLEGLTRPRDLVYYNGKIYWSDFEDGVIESIDVDGNNRQVINSDAPSVIDIEVDEHNDLLYWAENTGGIPGSGIFRSQLDGSQEELLLELFIHGIAVDGENDILYRTHNSRGDIFKVNLNDLTEDEQFIDGRRCRSISLDKENNKIYYVDNDDGNLLHSANLSNGSSIADLVTTDVYRPGSLEIDTINNKMYWVNQKGQLSNNERTDIMRADLDGSNLEFLISNPDLRGVTDLVLDIERGQMFWSDSKVDKIFKANLDGTGLEEIITELENPGGISFESQTEKIYWTEWGSDLIQRADVDGSNIEELVSENLQSPLGITIDGFESKMYWIDGGMINRSDTDGSNFETIIITDNPTFDKPQSVFIDHQFGKIYYPVVFSDHIARANLDGSEVEIIVEDGIESPSDVFLISTAPSNTSDIIPEFAKVYPNPFSEKISIESTKRIDEIVIYDETGKRVFVSNASSSIHDLSHLLPGIYMCQIRSKSCEQMIKVIKL